MKAVALVASEGSARASEARRALRLDPRTKVLMLVCANVTLLCSGFDAAGFVLKFLVAGIVVALLIAAGRRAAGIGFAAVFAAAALLEQMNERGLLDALGSTSAAAVTHPPTTSAPPSDCAATTIRPTRGRNASKFMERNA